MKKMIAVLLAFAFIPSISVAEEKSKLIASGVLAIGALVLHDQSGDYLKRASSRNSAIQARKANKFELGTLACLAGSVVFLTSYAIDVRLSDGAVILEKKLKF